MHSHPSCYPLLFEIRNEDLVDAGSGMFAEGHASGAGFVYDESDIELERVQIQELVHLAAFEFGSRPALQRLQKEEDIGDNRDM